MKPVMLGWGYNLVDKVHAGGLLHPSERTLGVELDIKRLGLEEVVGRGGVVKGKVVHRTVLSPIRWPGPIILTREGWQARWPAHLMCLEAAAALVGARDGEGDVPLAEAMLAEALSHLTPSELAEVTGVAGERLLARLAWFYFTGQSPHAAWSVGNYADKATGKEYEIKLRVAVNDPIHPEFYIASGGCTIVGAVKPSGVVESVEMTAAHCGRHSVGRVEAEIPPTLARLIAAYTAANPTVSTAYGQCWERRIVGWPQAPASTVG